MPELASDNPSELAAFEADDFGVYVHWPFCAAKCPYCDFNSHVRHGGVDQRAYREAFARELAHFGELAPGRTVSSIFFGGGTPSLMEPETVAAILEQIQSIWPVSHNVEITLEANPTSVEAARFAAYRSAGVNRVSLGIQSLEDKSLKFLGRLHTAKEALRALEIAHEHFPRVSFDLIYARPDQSEAEWEAELSQALSLATEHLSLYQLTIERGTPFFGLAASGKFVIPNEEAAARLYEVTQALTEDAGLPAYEISNHARPGAQSRHNLIYWRGQDYAGVGPGAHGRITTEEGKLATAAIRQPEDWLHQVASKGNGLEVARLLETEDRADEVLLMGLRLAEGVELNRLEALYDRPMNMDQVSFLEGHGLLQRIGNNRIRATLSGFLVLDALVADLAMPARQSI